MLPPQSLQVFAIAMYSTSSSQTYLSECYSSIIMPDTYMILLGCIILQGTCTAHIDRFCQYNALIVSKLNSYKGPYKWISLIDI